MPITGKQVNLLISLFIENGINGDQRRMDWLFDHDIDCPQFPDGKPRYEALSRDDLKIALESLGLKQ
jgi:hypothetical protein